MTKKRVAVIGYGDKVAIDGDILTPADRENCLARVRGALQLLYAAGDKIGSPRLKGAALDAMLAAQGLA